MKQNDRTAWHTWAEIMAQPSIWRQWANDFDPEPFQHWINGHRVDEVWFCGAGTSAYIGDIIAAGFEHQRSGLKFRSVASTDLVARPKDFLTDRRPLVVNFGRSGNSAETVGSLHALETLAPQVPRLNITCNKDSALAASVRKQDRLILLPEATHDKGFAMTSSFSTMFYCALMVFDRNSDGQQLSQAADIAEAVLPKILNEVGCVPSRAAFIGTGPLTFAAREAALKVMELTAGKVPCLWDSVLGFRHGPRSFLTKNSRLFVFTGFDTDQVHYESDLIAEVVRQFPALEPTTIGPGAQIDIEQPHGPLWAAPIMIAFSQIAGVVWSQNLGLNVDNPFDGAGTLTRVVSDVTLYEVN